MFSSNYNSLYRAAIAQQRKRILKLRSQVDLAQQQWANIKEVDDYDEDKEAAAAAGSFSPAINPINEPTSVLRERLFTNTEEVKDTSTEHVLQHHRMLQDDLSGAMLDMARGLKQRSIAFGEALKEDSKVPALERKDQS
jgi:hypothetical protein